MRIDIPALHLQHAPSVRIAPNARVPLPRDIAALIDHPMFQRLRGVRQLGFVDRVYPSATHSRFEHSLGVYHNAIHYIHALYEDPNSTYVRDTAEERDVTALLVAALCHDLGQYPYSHVLEDTERDADGRLPADSLFDHEAYTRGLLSRPEFRASVLIDCAPDAPDLDTLLKRVGVTAHDVLSVLTGRDLGELSRGMAETLHSVIDGPIDADKLDYLKRDSHHTGVDFGASIDEHRFFQSLTVVEEPSTAGDEPGVTAGTLPRHTPGGAPSEPRRVIALTEKGRVPAEEILIARWHMFTEVYWHRMTRAHEAVLATAIRRLRPLAEGFDEWFRSVVLHPRTTDEWFLELCRRLASGGPHELKLGVEGKPAARATVAKCVEMLASLSWSAGRAPYRRLISVSAADDPDLYETLQLLRNVAVARGQPVLDELAAEIAAQLAAAFDVKLDPLDLVLDVPAKRAPGNTVWMLSLHSPKRGSVERLANRSTMWREFGSTFHDHTREIRLFCPAAIRQRLREKVGERGNHLKLYDITREAALRVVRATVQLDLFGPPPPHRPA